MIESPYSSFINSEPSLNLSELGLSEVCDGESVCSMDMATDTGDLDVTGTLFGSLLSDDNSSASDSDDMLDYLHGRKSFKSALRKDQMKGTSSNLRSTNDSVVEHEIDVIDVSEGENSSVSCDSRSSVSLKTDTNQYITLYAKDLPRVSAGIQQQKARSRHPLMSAITTGPSLVVKIPRVDSKFPVPLKYQKENTLGNKDLSLRPTPKMLSTSEVENGNCDQNLSSDSKSRSKNAMIARNVRERKKKYVKDLEDSVVSLRMEKDNIETKYTQQCSHVEHLENEVQYLRNVIANQSTISALLNNVHKTPLGPGIEITTSLKCSKKRKTLDENDNQEVTANGIYVRASPRNKKVKKQSDDENEDSPPSTLPEEQSAKSEARMPLKAAKASIANKIARNRC